MLAGNGAANAVGVVLRIRLNKEAEDFVQHLTGVLTTSVDQFQAYGQYSTAPHHIKLIELPPTLGRVNFYLGTNSEVQATYARVVEVASRFSTVQGQITAKSTVNPGTGEVSLRVKSTDCLLLGRQLSSAVPGATDWYSRTEDGFSVSVGKFTGLPAHRAALEAWLNNELSASENIFPSFSSSSVEFSEDWMAIGLPAQTIALSALRPFGSFEPFGAAGAAAASTSAPAPVSATSTAAAAAAAAAVPPPAAPTPAAGTAAAPSAPPATPAEAPVETGPKKVWGSANGAVPQTLREAGLKATPEQPKFAPKVTPATAASAKAGGAAAAAATASKAAASAKPASAPASGPAEGSAAGGVSGTWTCPSCKLENFPRRTACFKCQADKPEQLGPALFHPRKPLITANKPEGDVRDGDWTCTSCKGHNFASKIACFTCRASRPGLDDAVAGADEAKSRPVSVKPGDWTCPKCKENVFAHRSRCYKCTTAKPGNF
jgi:Zn-finger in Ran binding protein and others